jgi:hypothetical protein
LLESIGKICDRAPTAMCHHQHIDCRLLLND